MKKFHYLLGALIFVGFTACSDDEPTSAPDGTPSGELPDWYYAGGELGTAFITTSAAFEQPTPAVENAGLTLSFKRGEQLFEKNFVSNTDGVRGGLGPTYLRSSCMHCHPGYGHGKSQPNGTFRTNEIGNGYLLVVYNPETNAYVNWLAGMPQGHAVAPFEAPLDESQITITWHDYTDNFGNKFEDGETYKLRYPEVDLPKEAVYAYRQGILSDAEMGEYDVRLESTIGIYGTGLLDAITDEDLKEQYAKEEKDGFMKNGLNPAFFANGDWTGQYTSKEATSDGKKYPYRFTYALSRGPLQDAAGANAFWNITNVTRSDRKYHYKDAGGFYAKAAAADPNVQSAFPAYIAQVDPDKKHPEWFTGDVEQNILNYMNSTNLDAEATDQNYIDLMVWHRGLAVPAVRNIEDEDVKRGKELFEEIGCAYCHRPSWTTGSDEIRDPAQFFNGSQGRELPRYPNQTIWPYTDMVQHKLLMINDIRTGWCRTTPLWGRGLHQRCTGSEYIDRLHDCRARTTLEAIMWHGTNEQSDAYETVVEFRKLSKTDRDAVIKFLDSI
ncbi:di-heme oxidoredictase family protein [Bacteroides gallinarum]|uniref:di-heme oxidoredictase family protein n=1 Tax=Bacteroides gallinarum TaxID=376806 RepID=UPI0003773786|nr:di-heme oxidoredictase family protein [Bacteroides gallinarum]